MAVVTSLLVVVADVFVTVGQLIFQLREQFDSTVYETCFIKNISMLRSCKRSCKIADL